MIVVNPLWPRTVQQLLWSPFPFLLTHKSNCSSHDITHSGSSFLVCLHSCEKKMACRKRSNCHQVCKVQLSRVPWHTSLREENSLITKMEEINIKLSFPCSKRYPFNSMESVSGAHQHWHPSALFRLFNTPHCNIGKRKGQTLFVTVAYLVLWPGIWRQLALERKS